MSGMIEARRVQNRLFALLAERGIREYDRPWSSRPDYLISNNEWIARLEGRSPGALSRAS